MSTECSLLVVMNNCLPEMPEDSEMITITDCLTNLPSSNQAELVISSYSIPIHLHFELTNDDRLVVPIQQTTFETGELVTGISIMQNTTT